MNNLPRFTNPMFICAALMAGASPSLQATINYGDFGPGAPPAIMIYTDVREASTTDAEPLDMLGAPFLTGNNLGFLPIIGAWAGSGNADITDGQLNFGLSVPRQKLVVAGGFTSLLIRASGDYSLFGAGTALTSVLAGVSVSIEIFAVDGVPITPITSFASSTFSADLVASGPIALAPWGNVLFLDLGPVLAANNINVAFGVTSARVVINNQLISLSEAASLAFISNKSFEIRPIVELNPAFKAKK